jgi:hypothetical protein
MLADPPQNAERQTPTGVVSGLAQKWTFLAAHCSAALTP